MMCPGPAHGKAAREKRRPPTRDGPSSARSAQPAPDSRGDGARQGQAATVPASQPKSRKALSGKRRMLPDGRYGKPGWKGEVKLAWTVYAGRSHRADQALVPGLVPGYTGPISPGSRAQPKLLSERRRLRAPDREGTAGDHRCG